MKTKSLLLGSAAALFAVTGARAADAVIIPEPEMVEYVRVCDAAGTGYFYIPGTETCLKIGGYVRFQINSDSTFSDETARRFEDSSGYVDFASKASLQVSSWTDSEIGPIATFYELVTTSGGTVAMDSAYLSFAGLKMGYFGGFLDNGINGEQDGNGLSNKFDTIQYTGTAGGLSFGLAIDELTVERGNGVWTHVDGAQFGVSGMVGFTTGGVSATVSGGYDTLYEEWVAVVRASADVGMGTLQGRFTWASDMSGYNTWMIGGDSPMEWVAEASYAAKINDKLTLTPGFSYANAQDGDDLWTAGMTADYTIAANLAAKLSVQYESYDDDQNNVDDWDGFSGFLRFQASF